MIINEKDQPLTEKKINVNLKTINSTIDKLVIDREKSDKIIGLVIGIEISCFLTLLADISQITEPNKTFSFIRIILLGLSIIIRNRNLKENLYRDIDIEMLKLLKEDIINDNERLNKKNIDNSQKTLKY